MSELSPEAKRLFEAARQAYSPSSQQLDALQVAMQARLAAEAAAASGAGTAASGAAKVALAVKLATVLGLATAVAVGASMLGGSKEPAAPVASGSIGSAPATSQPRPAAPAEAAARPSAAPSAPSAEARPSAAPSASSAEAPSVEPAPAVPRVDPAVAAVRPERSGARSAVARRAARSSAPPAGLPASKQAHASTPAAVVSAVGRSEPAAAVEPGPEPEPEREAEPERRAPPVVARDELDAEIRLLRAARAALESGAAERALAILDEHAELHPRGTLAQERMATRALALCALGREQAARATVRELSRLSPSSPHLTRLRASCAWPAEQ